VTYSQEWYAKAPFAEEWWRGWPIVKHPNDLHVYAEIIWQTRPTLIVETGTFAGGSALYLADMLEIAGGGDVISIDLNVNPELPDDERITFLQGLSSIDKRVLEAVRGLGEGRKTMVVLDSDHSADHVFRELNAYAPFVSMGCYLIVEDTNRDAYRQMFQNGHLDTDLAGPAEALKRWQPTNKGFMVDRRRERFLFSQNPGGYLKKVK
jgi:cephalosporin hydroxylase